MHYDNLRKTESMPGILTPLTSVFVHAFYVDESISNFIGFWLDPAIREKVLFFPLVLDDCLYNLKPPKVFFCTS